MTLATSAGTEPFVPLTHAVHLILSLPAPAAATLADLSALRDAAAALDDSEWEERRAKLIARLNVPLAPGELERLMTGNVGVTSLFRKLRDPSRALGTADQHQRIVDDLLDHAAHAAEPIVRRYAARAAITLAAQEGFVFGTTLLCRCLAAPSIDERCGWAAARMQRLREQLAAERRHVATFAPALADAARTLQQMIDQPADRGLDAAGVRSLIGALDRLLIGARWRPHFEWWVANFTWKTVNLATDRGRPEVVAEMRAAANRWREWWPVDPFTRWIDEAFTTPWPAPTRTGIDLVTPAQLRARTLRVRVARTA